MSEVPLEMETELDLEGVTTPAPPPPLEMTPDIFKMNDHFNYFYIPRSTHEALAKPMGLPSSIWEKGIYGKVDFLVPRGRGRQVFRRETGRFRAKGEHLERFADFHLKATARIWP